MNIYEQQTPFEKRLLRYHDELKELYLSLYPGMEDSFFYFCQMLEANWEDRKAELRALDEQREQNPDWYRTNRLLGMTMYADHFADTLNALREKLPYVQECGVNYLHLLPMLDSPKGKSDGGYAVSDFRAVRPDLGTMEDLETLADCCRKKGICLATDFSLNHTSDEHPWAIAARNGDCIARSRYFFYDSWDIPAEFEKTLPQSFPITAPGNFTWLQDCGMAVMTTFYPYEWDLNYANPMVFNDMTDNLLFLANRGLDVLRLNAIPYLWKELYTSCRDLPQVHTLVKMLRLACRIVCPGVIIAGEVVVEGSSAAAYFGAPDNRECQILGSPYSMAATWNTLATRDTRMLQRHIMQKLPLLKEGMFQNYLRTHNDIAWLLDYKWLALFGSTEEGHKRYLNTWFTGTGYNSPARGELCNEDPSLRQGRLCGTTASLAGLETAESESALSRAVTCDLMLHAWLLTQSGIPMLYSGDEIGTLNDYRYHNSTDPDVREDARYLHRSRFDWERAALRSDVNSIPGRIFYGLRKLTTIRTQEQVFHPDAEVAMLDTCNLAVLGIRRSYKGETMVALFNFSDQPQTAVLSADCTDLFANLQAPAGTYKMSPYTFYWLKENN